MRILGLIPARGGSKGVPRKNIKLLNGKPLIWYTAKAALCVKELSDVILSTEDIEIAQVGKECGLEVPFLRPKHMAEDESPTLPVIQHALRYLMSKGKTYDAVCLLQPTSPFRGAKKIKECIDLFTESNADTLITLVPVPETYNPIFMYFKKFDSRLENCIAEQTIVSRRQDVHPAYLREGSVYIIRTKVLMDQETIYGPHIVGCEVKPEDSINIDSLEDWIKAEKIFKERECDKNQDTYS